MAYIVIIMLGILSVFLYTRTRKPKLTAVMNGLAGLASLFAGQLIANGDLSEINFCNTALSVITGIPGGVLVAFLNLV